MSEGVVRRVAWFDLGEWIRKEQNAKAKQTVYNTAGVGYITILHCTISAMICLFM